MTAPVASFSRPRRTEANPLRTAGSVAGRGQRRADAAQQDRAQSGVDSFQWAGIFGQRPARDDLVECPEPDLRRNRRVQRRDRALAHRFVQVAPDQIHEPGMDSQHPRTEFGAGTKRLNQATPSRRPRHR